MSKLSGLVSSAAILFGAGLLAGPASAGPASGLAGLAETPSSVELVHSRCWRHRGHWHCPGGVRHSYYGGYPYYGAYAPYYGYGPTIGFSFGSRGFYRGGHHFRGHRGRG